jgi:hypothetical protein
LAVERSSAFHFFFIIIINKISRTAPPPMYRYMSGIPGMIVDEAVVGLGVAAAGAGAAIAVLLGVVTG